MKYTAGIDLGGTIIKIGLNDGGKLLGTVRIPADSAAGLGPALDRIAGAVDSLAAEFHADRITGVALAFPGIVDVKAGRAAGTNAKYCDAPSLDLAAWTERHWKGARFAIDNDARMAAVGEWKAGAGAGCENMVMMTIGTGIGTGAVVDGRLIYGRNWCAGALGGHFTVDFRGRKCTCGNTGCVEALASSYFLPQIIAAVPGLDDEFRNDPENRNFKALFGQYVSGSRNAAAVVEYCMDVWSAAVIDYVHAYDPEIVVLGGGIMKSADIIIPYIDRKVNTSAFRPEGAGDVRIVAAALGDDAAIIGADYYFE